MSGVSCGLHILTEMIIAAYLLREKLDWTVFVTVPIGNDDDVCL